MTAEVAVDNTGPVCFSHTGGGLYALHNKIAVGGHNGGKFRQRFGVFGRDSAVIWSEVQLVRRVLEIEVAPVTFPHTEHHPRSVAGRGGCIKIMRNPHGAGKG